MYSWESEELFCCPTPLRVDQVLADLVSPHTVPSHGEGWAVSFFERLREEVQGVQEVPGVLPEVQEAVLKLDPEVFVGAVVVLEVLDLCCCAYLVIFQLFLVEH